MNFWRARQNAAGDWVVDRFADGRIVRFGNYGANEDVAKTTARNLNRALSHRLNAATEVQHAA